MLSTLHHINKLLSELETDIEIKVEGKWIPFDLVGVLASLTGDNDLRETPKQKKLIVIEENGRVLSSDYENRIDIAKTYNYYHTLYGDDVVVREFIELP